MIPSSDVGSTRSTAGPPVPPVSGRAQASEPGGRSGPSPVVRLLQAGIVVVTVLEILDELRLLRRRVVRDRSDVWARAARKERVNLRRAEAGYLLRGIGRVRR